MVDLEEQLRYFRRAVSELDSRRSEIAALHASTQSALVQLRIEAAEARSLAETVRQTLITPDEISRRYGAGREAEERLTRRLDSLHDDIAAEVRRQVQMALQSTQPNPVVEDLGRRLGEVESRVGEVNNTVAQSRQAVDYLSRKAADEWTPAVLHVRDVQARVTAVESAVGSMGAAQRELEAAAAENRRGRDAMRSDIEALRDMRTEVDRLKRMAEPVSFFSSL